MTAKELLNPRFEVIAEYPNCAYTIGSFITCPHLASDLLKNQWVKAFERYPHLFRKMQWWEGRNQNEMPKRILFLGDNKDTIFEISHWDVLQYIGYIKDKDNSCNLTIWKPEFGYIPVD